jgi:ATP-dependent DNA helicase RecQ
MVDPAEVLEGPVLLVDDMVDSKWTFTITGALLQEAGAEMVYPFALADSSQAGG